MATIDWFDYQDARLWEVRLRYGRDGDPSFDTLLVALINKADDQNLRRIRAGFPAEVAEVQQRNGLPGGLLPSDPDVARDEVYGPPR